MRRPRDILDPPFSTTSVKAGNEFLRTLMSNMVPSTKVCFEVSAPVRNKNARVTSLYLPPLSMGSKKLPPFRLTPRPTASLSLFLRCWRAHIAPPAVANIRVRTPQEIRKPKVVAWKRPEKEKDMFAVGEDTGQAPGNDPVMLLAAVGIILGLSYVFLG